MTITRPVGARSVRPFAALPRRTVGAWRGPARIALGDRVSAGSAQIGTPLGEPHDRRGYSNAIVRLLAALVSLSCALAGCGRGTAGPASLAKLLPDEVGGAELHREAFTGKVWLKSRPQQFFSPEVRANVSKFLERLRKSPSDLSVAWALLPDGVPRVVAYRVRGASGGHARGVVRGSTGGEDLLGQDLGLRQGRDRHFSWPRPSPRISLCQGRHSVFRLDGLHKSTRVWRVAARAAPSRRGCSLPSVRNMPERARFLAPVTGSALRALREHRLPTDKFRRSTSAAW
jgi:hypothetical protein